MVRSASNVGDFYISNRHYLSALQLFNVKRYSECVLDIVKSDLLTRRQVLAIGVVSWNEKQDLQQLLRGKTTTGSFKCGLNGSADIPPHTPGGARAINFFVTRILLALFADKLEKGAMHWKTKHEKVEGRVARWCPIWQMLPKITNIFDAKNFANICNAKILLFQILPANFDKTFHFGLFIRWITQPRRENTV